MLLSVELQMPLPFLTYGPMEPWNASTADGGDDGRRPLPDVVASPANCFDSALDCADDVQRQLLPPRPILACRRTGGTCSSGDSVPAVGHSDIPVS